MQGDKPVLRALKLLTVIESNSAGLRVADMAEQLGAPSRAIYPYLDVLQQSSSALHG